MRLPASSLESLLVVANVLAATFLLVVVLTAGSASPESNAPLGSESSAPVLFVVSAGGPDVLVARPAARAVGGSVMAVPDSGIADEHRDELLRLDPGRIVLVGGPAAVSDAIATQLHDVTKAPVSRISGGDRYATAARLATAAFSSPLRRVVVTSGQEVGEPRDDEGGLLDGPVLLVSPDHLPDATAEALRVLRPRNVTVLGDRDEVSEAVVDQLWGHTPTRGVVTRLPGGGRAAA